MKFKPGDKVRCVKGQLAQKLIEGDIYEVVRYEVGTPLIIYVKGTHKEHIGFFESRFVLAEENVSVVKKEKIDYMAITAEIVGSK